jgi:hypothetical protein
MWCLAGEGAMPYYLSQNKEEDSKFQKSGWTEIGQYVRSIDPYHNIISIHPTDNARDQVENPEVLDFEMLQTGHGDRASIGPTVSAVVGGYGREPRMPVVESEVCYEGIGEACRQEIQRAMFWACMLNGAAGYTYGANGIWQVNTRQKPYGPSPHGLAWGNTPWEDAYQLPGSYQIGVGKKFLERYEWWNFESHPEWVEPHWTSENYCAPYAAGIPGKVRIIYFPLSWFMAGKVANVESDANYRAFLFNPTNGEETDLGDVVPKENGEWDLPVGSGDWHTMPIFQDWVLVLEAK